MVGEVCEYDELAGIYEKLDTVRITTSPVGLGSTERETSASDLTPSVLYEEQRRHGVIEREKTVVCLYTIQIKLTGCCESERIDLRY